MNEEIESLQEILNETLIAFNELQNRQVKINDSQAQTNENFSNFNNNLMTNLESCINKSIKQCDEIFHNANIKIKNTFADSQESLSNFKKEIENISSNAKKITKKQIALTVLVSLFVGLLGGFGLSCYFVNEKFYEWEQNALSEKVYLERKNKESYENANSYIKFLVDYNLFDDISFEVVDNGKPTVYIASKRIKKSFDASTTTTGKKWKAFEMTKK